MKHFIGGRAVYWLAICIVGALAVALVFSIAWSGSEQQVVLYGSGGIDPTPTALLSPGAPVNE